MESLQNVNTPALSVRQPWAELIVTGRKTIEVRSWATEYRGRIWLHAAKASEPDLERAFGVKQTFKGGFIGSVRLSAIVPLDDRRWSNWRPRHLVSGPYRPGQFGWVLESPIRFKSPIPARGHLNLFRPDATLQATLKEAESHADPALQT
jgi:hypothetical protein